MVLHLALVLALGVGDCDIIIVVPYQDIVTLLYLNIAKLLTHPHKISDYIKFCLVKI